jgi:sodium pump decarboxylase gamma subunit
MEGSYVLSVVLTGLTVVFLGLILLIIFVWLMGKIFDAIKDSKNKAKAEKEAAAKPAANAPAPAPAPVSAPAIENEDGISDEIIAVIAAAVASMGSYAVKSVKKAPAKSSRRTAWGAQGVSESTRAF